MPIVPAAAFISAADTAGSRRMGPRSSPNRTRITGAIAVTPPTTTANTRASRDQSPIRPTATTNVLMPKAAIRARPQTVNWMSPTTAAIRAASSWMLVIEAPRQVRR